MKTKFNFIVKICILLTLVKTLTIVAAVGQSSKNYPKVGTPIFDFTFTDILNYPQKQVSIREFRGKWLLLDLWGRTCSSCLASFPKMDSISKKFGDKLQVIMVGAIVGRNKTEIEKSEKLTKHIYNRLAEKHNLTFTVAFDSIFYEIVNPEGYPHLLIIDPDGIVRYKTASITDHDLQAIFAKRPVDLYRVYSRNEPKLSKGFNKDLPLLTNGTAANGGIDTGYLYRSMLTYMTPEMRAKPNINLKTGFNAEIKSGLLEVLGINISELYRLAYFGTTSRLDPNFPQDIYHPLVFENIDSTIISKLKKERYAYSLTIPKERANVDYYMKILKNELDNYFGYHSQLEMREVPAYFLIANDDIIAKLSTKGGASRMYFDEAKNKFCIINTNFDMLASLFGRRIASQQTGIDSEEPVFNGTGFSGNFDLELDFRPEEFYYFDGEDMKQILEKVGIHVKKGTKVMKALVLKEDSMLKAGNGLSSNHK